MTSVSCERKIRVVGRFATPTDTPALSAYNSDDGASEDSDDCLADDELEARKETGHRGRNRRERKIITSSMIIRKGNIVEDVEMKAWARMA